MIITATPNKVVIRCEEDCLHNDDNYVCQLNRITLETLSEKHGEFRCKNFKERWEE